VKVKLLSSLAGAYRSGGPGEEWECDEDEAQRLIERGMAERIETTSEVPPENAMRPKAPPRKRQPSDGPSPKDSEPLEASR